MKVHKRLKWRSKRVLGEHFAYRVTNQNKQRRNVYWLRLVKLAVFRVTATEKWPPA